MFWLSVTVAFLAGFVAGALFFRANPNKSEKFVDKAREDIKAAMETAVAGIKKAVEDAKADIKDNFASSAPKKQGLPPKKS